MPLRLPFKALDAEARIVIEHSEAFASLSCELIKPYSARFSLGEHYSAITVSSYLIEWLKNIAYRFIEPRLQFYADKMGLTYQGLQIARINHNGAAAPDKRIT